MSTEPVQPGVPVYGRGRFPKQRGHRVCRGCGGTVTDTRRRTWCSKECWERFEPSRVIVAVVKRDNHVCQMCGIDIRAALIEWRARRAAATFEDRMKLGPGPREEYDHVVPFCEGGLTVIENMQTLCSDCHKKKTRKWRMDRAKARKDHT